jgi:hypothetical protein
MIKVFKTTHRRVRKTNEMILTTKMSVSVTTTLYSFEPLYYGSKEIKNVTMQGYPFDYQKTCWSKNNFEVKQLI